MYLCSKINIYKYNPYIKFAVARSSSQFVQYYKILCDCLEVRFSKKYNCMPAVFTCHISAVSKILIHFISHIDCTEGLQKLIQVAHL